MKVRYTGTSDARVLSSEDMARLGVEDHEGFHWTKDTPVVDTSDAVGKALLEAFPREMSEDEEPDLAQEKTKEELLELAREQDIPVTSRMTKEEIVEAIEASSGSSEST